MKKDEGQSLLEMILALAVAVLVVLALVRLTVSSIRNATFAKNKALATKHAQEWIEEARGLRDQEAETFFVDGSCNASEAGFFSWNRICALSGDTMTVTVTVSWTDASGDHETELKTSLTDWR